VVRRPPTAEQKRKADGISRWWQIRLLHVVEVIFFAFFDPKETGQMENRKPRRMQSMVMLSVSSLAAKAITLNAKRRKE